MLRCRQNLLLSSIIIPHVVGLSSHHIYNDEKKHYIILEAVNRNLSGVYLFGKPGRIVVEGNQDDVRRYSAEIRSWRWQKIAEVEPICPSYKWLQRSVGKSASTRSSEKETRKNSKQKQQQHKNEINSNAAPLLITEESRIFEDGKFIEVVSERELREFLRQRNVEELARMLARPFSAGRVI